MILPSLSSPPVQAEDELQLENWPVFRAGPAGSTLEPSAVMDDDGVVHAVYLYRDPAYSDWYLRPNYLRYANLSQGTWEHADLQAGFFEFADIALDAEGNAHILCATTWNYKIDVMYWNNTNGTWACQNVTQMTMGGARNADMAVDAEGKVHAVMGLRSLQGEDNLTYYYVTNAREGWELVPFHYTDMYDVQTSELICMPDIEIDSTGKVHIAYVKVDNAISGDWDSGDWSLQLLTRDGDNWTDAKNISLPDRCNSLSLQIDGHGHEHVLYHCVTSSMEEEGPVFLATWNASGLSWGGITDGTGECELHLDADGSERFIFMHEDGYFFVGAYGQGSFDRSVRFPAGTYPASRDPGDMTDNRTVILLFDSMCEELLLYMPGSLSLYQEISEIERDKNEVRLEWQPAEASVTEFRIYRTAIWGEEVPITVLSGSPFVFPADVTNMTDATIGDIPTWTLLSYRVSVVTAEGEYLGEMETIHVDDGWDEGLDMRDLWLLVAAVVIVSVSFITAVWLLIWKKR